MAAPEESLGTQRVPATDASFENSSNHRMDAEMALLRCGASFTEKMVTFQFLTMGGTYRARNTVGRKFGIGPSRVADMADLTLNRMVSYLAGKREPPR